MSDGGGPGEQPVAAEPGRSGGDRVRLTVWVEGRVHGVGFRWWARSAALELGLTGVAQNLPDGRVKVVAEGSEAGCRELLGRIEGPGTPGQVVRVTQRWDRPSGRFPGFAER